MGKRALGIPAVDASSLSRKSRWARLGIHVPKTSAASSTHASAGSSADGTPGEQLRAAQHHRGDQVLKLADRKEDKAQSSSEFKALAAHVQGALDELQVLREAQERHVQDVSSRLSVLQSHEPPMFLRNMDSRTGAMHKVLFAGLGAHWSAWRSFCGWRFGRANYEFQGSFSEADSLCEKCFPEHRAARPGADSDSCVSASDASASGSN